VTDCYTDRAVPILADRPVVSVLAAVIVLLSAGTALGQADAARVSALLRELKHPDFERANAAASELRNYRPQRARVVAGLTDAIKTGEWNRCSGDMRDTIARHLGEMKAKDAVVPLLELVKAGKSIEHECAE
jgi:HEAT repeat protein